jgi:UDP-GlcNAc:undecaprenyl-phosphate/decaprenyl-phosphate GlcNAc-1-phosphate transferase
LFLILTLGVISIILALILTPLVRDCIGKFGFLDHPDGDRKVHATALPRVGGIAIVISYIATFGIALALPFTYTYVLRNALPNIVQLSLVAGVVFFTGVLDDLVGLNAWQKLIGIGSAAVLAFFAGIRVDIHILHGLPAWPWLGFAITVLWLIACTNAFNLIDGMDGLAAGVGLVATLTMLIAALTQGNLPLALATMPLAGCLLGFLRYNFNPASVFLGDGGSLLIGFMLGCYGALWSEKSVTLVALTVPLLSVSIPLLDVGLSIFRRFLRDRPIFKADRGHIHHKLLDRGLSPKRAVLTIYVICSVAAVGSLIVSATHNQYSGLIVLLFCGAAWIGIQHLEYPEFAMAGKMFLKGKFRQIIDTETRLLEFETALAQTTNLDDCWSRVLAGTREFGFQGVRLSINGTVFEDLGSRNGHPVWQLRIPLADAHYINFFRDFTAEINPLILSAFVKSVERGLKSSVERGIKPKASSRVPEVIRIPAAAQLFYTARAGAGVESASANGD